MKQILWVTFCILVLWPMLFITQGAHAMCEKKYDQATSEECTELIAANKPITRKAASSKNNY